MKILRLVLPMMLIFAASFSLSACNNDGPFEEAGESIDEAVDDTADEIEDACEEAKESMGAKDDDC